MYCTVYIQTFRYQQPPPFLVALVMSLSCYGALEIVGLLLLLLLLEALARMRYINQRLTLHCILGCPSICVCVYVREYV